MSRQVRIAAGQKQVAMPNGRMYDTTAGAVDVTLTDNEFNALSQRLFSGGTLIDLGRVSDSDPDTVHRGAWAVGINYGTGDMVRLPAFGTYIALAPNVGVAPNTDPTKWALVAADSPPGPGAELGYAETTSQLASITATTVATAVLIPGLTKTVNVAAGQAIYVEASVIVSGIVAAAGAACSACIIIKDEGGIEVGRAGFNMISGGGWVTVLLRRRLTPTAGTHTYNVHLLKVSGDSVGSLATAAAPSSLRITAA